jgi:hypothetical protein
MKRCTVSVIDGDGEPHQVAVNAASLFDAVDQAIEPWSRLWWFNGGAVERAGLFSEAKVRASTTGRWHPVYGG